MSKKRVQVYMRLKNGVLDVQGKAVEHGLTNIGIDSVSDIRIGRLIELSVDAAEDKDAVSQTEEICKQLLANPVIENYEIKVVG